jgi:hypothetical protein
MNECTADTVEFRDALRQQFKELDLAVEGNDVPRSIEAAGMIIAEVEGYREHWVRLKKWGLR